MQSEQNRIQNQLLAGLPPAEFVRLIPSLRPVAFARDVIIYKPDDLIAFIYFPSGGLILEVMPLEDRMRSEGLSIGREGAVGISALSGTKISSYKLAVRTPGAAWRITPGELLCALPFCPVLKNRLGQYLYIMLLRAPQTGLCTKSHTIARRCASKLMEASGRSGSQHVSFTFEGLAIALGVLPAGVSKAISALEGDGIIRCMRGSIEIIDRERLKQSSCGCSACRPQANDKLLLGGAGDANSVTRH